MSTEPNPEKARAVEPFAKMKDLSDPDYDFRPRPETWDRENEVPKVSSAPAPVPSSPSGGTSNPENPVTPAGAEKVSPEEKKSEPQSTPPQTSSEKTSAGKSTPPV